MVAQLARHGEGAHAGSAGGLGTEGKSYKFSDRISRSNAALSQTANVSTTYAVTAPLRGGPPEHNDLLPQEQIFGFKAAPRSEQSDQQRPQQFASIPYRATGSSDSSSRANRITFPTGTGLVSHNPPCRPASSRHARHQGATDAKSISFLALLSTSSTVSTNG